MALTPITSPAGYAPAFALGYADSTTGALSLVNPSAPLPVTSTSIAPEPWSDTTAAWDVRACADAEVQFVGTPATPYQPQRSLDGANYVNTLAYDQSGTSYSTITVAGIYAFDGNGYLKFSAGAGSTLTRRAAS